MEIYVVASGSNGNCCLVRQKDSAVLIDAGKSAKVIEQRLNELGTSLESVNSILLTHAHHDHICGAGAISRKYNIPVSMGREVYSEARFKLGDIIRKTFLKSESFKIGDLNIKPVPTSHNIDSCGFVINDFGLFTDTGIVTPAMEAVFPKLKAVLLESNHDIDKLINGPYPTYLKQWILSDQGHLSNIDASNFIQKYGENLSLVLLGHLSGTNNTPELTRSTYESLVKRKLDYAVCSREKASGRWEI